ncbi:MAG TPA: peptidyl-prolyl cis-trans isomerase, partial [Stellaceae bacterium]|nr:peptidyl-prolyl cis-trans isomerase [Stellaceae bacterium]
GVLDAIVEQIVDRSLLDQEVGRLRLDLSDDVVRKAITENPAFRGPDGRFSRDLFNQVLATNRLSEDALVARLRQDIPRGDLLQAVTAGVVVPDPVVDTIYRYRNEKRVADVVSLPLSAAGDIAAPSDDDLTKYYDAHPDLFRAAEYRGFTLVSLTAADLEGDIKISDDRLKSAYEERKDDFNTPEQRQMQQILAPSEGKAKEAEAAITAGKDWQEVATLVGQDPKTVDIGLVKQDDLPKPLADPAFDLELNKPSEPIKTALGWHILRVVRIEPPKTPGFDAVKEQLTKDLLQEEAADRLDRVANAVDDALAGGAPLADVAAKHNLKVTTVDAVDLSGRDLDGKLIVLPVDLKSVLKTVFESAEKETSRVTATEEGAIFAVRIDKIVAPRVKPLGEVKDRVAAAWQGEQKQAAVKKRADEIVAAVAAGTPLAKAAADKGVAVTTSPPLERRPQPGSTVPAVLVVKLFAAKVGDTVTASDAVGAYVGQLKATDAPDKTPEAAAKALTTELGNSTRYDLVGELTGALKKRYPVTIHHDVLDRMF